MQVGQILIAAPGGAINSRPPAEHHTAMSRPVPACARGFTLLELLVVMVIIGLLAGYVGPKFFGQIGKSEVKATKAQIDALQKSLDQYRLDVGRYPSTEQGLAVLVAKPADEPKWAGPYLSKALPKDPWGNDYQYRSPGEHGEYDLLSFGKDGRPGGEGEDADLTSW
jgi:general secretion pathway protein G